MWDSEERETRRTIMEVANGGTLMLRTTTIGGNTGGTIVGTTGGTRAGTTVGL